MSKNRMVGAARFELATPSPPDWCANQAAPRSVGAMFRTQPRVRSMANGDSPLNRYRATLQRLARCRGTRISAVPYCHRNQKDHTQRRHIDHGRH